MKTLRKSNLLNLCQGGEREKNEEMRKERDKEGREDFTNWIISAISGGER